MKTFIKLWQLSLIFNLYIACNVTKSFCLHSTVIFKGGGELNSSPPPPYCFIKCVQQRNFLTTVFYLGKVIF